MDAERSEGGTMTSEAYLEIHTIGGPLRVVDPRSPVANLLVRPAVTIGDSYTLREAAQLMREASVSALVVGGGAGIITERDLARAVGEGRSLEDPVATVMTCHPLVVRADSTVIEAAGVMLNEDVRHLLVALEDGRLGVLSIRELLAVLLQAVDPHVWLASLRVAIGPPSELWLG